MYKRQLSQSCAASVPVGYSARFAADHVGNDLTSIPRSQVWLAQNCNRNPECGSFSSDAQLRFAVSRSSTFEMAKSIGACVYEKSPDRVQWVYQSFKDFEYSCIYFSILSVTQRTGPLSTDGFLNQSTAPFDNNCQDLDCCRSLCDSMLTSCWAYTFGTGVDSGCNNGGTCCRLAGHLLGPPGSNLPTPAQNRGSRRCQMIKDRDANVLKLHRNLTSFVKHFISPPTLPEFQSLVNATHAVDYVAAQEQNLHNCLPIPGYNLRNMWTHYSNTVGNEIANDVPFPLSTFEVQTAAMMCDFNPNCQSFNNQINLKSSSTLTLQTSTNQPRCLFVRQGLIKIQPDDQATCLASSSQSNCAQCAQILPLSDRTSCFRCLSSASLPASQCLAAVKDGRLLNYSAGLVSSVFPNSTVAPLCSAYKSLSPVDIFSSDNIIYLALKASPLNTSMLNRTLRSEVDDAMPLSKFFVPVSRPTCFVFSGYFRPNATGNWSFWGYGDDGLHLWVGPGATYGEHVLNSLLAIDFRMQ